MWGVQGGYQETNVRTRSTASRTDVDSWNIGLHVAWYKVDGC